MIAVTLGITLTIEGPVLTRSSSAMRFGIDAGAARDSKGRLYLPYSLVKGKLKEAWSELASFASVPDCQLYLGRDTSDDDDWQSERARLFFTDFVAEKIQVERYYSTRISLDDSTLAAENGAIFVQEQAVKAGKLVSFTGSVRYLCASKEESQVIKKQVLYAFNWLMNAGSGFSVGMGQIKQVKLNDDVQTSLNALQSEKPVQALRVTFNEAFCIAKPRRGVSNNLFESTSVLSGGVVRGAMANMLKTITGLAHDAEINATSIPESKPFHTLARYFSAFTIKPALAKKLELGTPFYPPLSLVKATDPHAPHGEFFDVALCETPTLIRGSSPAFSTDWKGDDGIFASEFAFVEPDSEIRVRTAIDSSGTSKEAALFSYESVKPEGFEWIVELDTSCVAEEHLDAFFAELRALLSVGLFAVGKTKAHANVEFIEALTSPEFDANNSCFVLSLKSKALMFDPRDLQDSQSHESLKQAYQAYFDAVAPESFTLKRFFASQSLEAGYRLKSQHNETYYPFVLSDAGSVFVLEAKDSSKATEAIRSWLKTGLELSSNIKDLYGDSWHKNPYTPEDGFGCIQVNLACHSDKKLQEAS